MSLSNLSPTLETFKIDYQQDVARLYFEWRPFMLETGFTDEHFVRMMQNFSDIYATQKERIRRYRFGDEFDPSVVAELDEDEKVENILMEEFIESIEPPPVSTLPKEVETLKANFQKDVLIVWNCLDRDGIHEFDHKISNLFEKMKRKYIKQRERLRKIMLGSEYLPKNVCFSSSDPEFIITNELNAFSLTKASKSRSTINFSFKTNEDTNFDPFDETKMEDSPQSKLMKLKRHMIIEGKKIYFEALDSNTDPQSQLESLQEKYVNDRERIKQDFDHNYVINKNFSEGSDILLISQQWKSGQVNVNKSQVEEIREQSFNDERVPKRIISDGSQEQDMIALACKTLRDETRKEIADPNKLNIVYELLNEAIESAAQNQSIFKQSLSLDRKKIIENHGKTFSGQSHVYSASEPSRDKSLPMDPSSVDPTQYNLNDIINMSLKDLQKLHVPQHLKRRTVDAELDHLKRGYANALAKCLKKHVNGTFDDLLLVLRKLNMLQDMYIEKRERLKMRYIEDYDTISHELNPRSSTMNVLLKPYLKRIMGPRYRPRRTVEDFVNELISEDTNRIVYKHLVASMESPIKKFPEVKHEVEQQYMTNLRKIRKGFGRKIPQKMPQSLSPRTLLLRENPQGDELEDIPGDRHPAERSLTQQDFEKIRARYAPMNERILENTAVLDENMLINPNDYLMLLLRAKNVLHNFDVESRDYAEKVKMQYEPEGVPIVKLHPQATTGIYHYKTPKRQRKVKVLSMITEEIPSFSKSTKHLQKPSEFRTRSKIPSIPNTQSFLPKPQLHSRIMKPSMIPQASHIPERTPKQVTSRLKEHSFIPKPPRAIAVSYVKPKPSRRQSLSQIPISETPVRVVIPKRRSLAVNMESRLPIMRKRAGGLSDDTIDATEAPDDLFVDDDDDLSEDALKRLARKTSQVEKEVFGNVSDKVFTQKRIATKPKIDQNLYETDNFDEVKEYSEVLSPDEDEYHPVYQKNFQYHEWEDDALDFTEAPQGFMSEERGEVYLPDMINLNENENTMPKIVHPAPIPKEDESDLNYGTLRHQYTTDEAVAQLVRKARKIQEDAARELGEEFTQVKFTKPQENINLLDMSGPEMQLEQPMQPVYAPIQKQKPLMELDISHEELPAPINPTYSPLKPAIDPSTSSTLGTSSSEALFCLNLPKDFIQKPPTPEKKSRNLFNEIAQKAINDSLFNTSVPDEDFYFDSDPEIRRKNYKLVDISSPETSFRHLSPEKQHDRLSRLTEFIPEDDLFDTDLPQSFGDSLSDVSVEFEEPYQTPREFTPLPFAPSQFTRRRQRLLTGRPMPAIEPPEYLYTLNEEMQSPGGRYRLASPRKMRRVKAPRVIVPRKVIREPITIDFDKESTSSDEVSKIMEDYYLARRTRQLPEDLKAVVGKYDDIKARSPLSSEAEEQKIDQLRTCLAENERKCVEQFQKRPNKFEDRVAFLEEQLAQQIADEMANKSPVKIVPDIDREKAIADVEKIISDLRAKKAKEDKARAIAEQKRKKQQEIAEIEKNLSKVDKDMEEWLKEQKKFDKMMAEKRKKKAELAQQLEALKSPPINPQILRKSALQKRGVPQKLLERLSKLRPTPIRMLKKQAMETLSTSKMSGQRQKPVRRPTGSKPTTSDASVARQNETMKKPQTRPSTSNTSIRARPSKSTTSVTRPGTRPTSHKKAGFVKNVAFKETSDDIKTELNKLFIEFSEKLKQKGLLPTPLEYFKRQTNESFELLLEKSGFKSSSENSSNEIVLETKDLTKKDSKLAFAPK